MTSSNKNLGPVTVVMTADKLAEYAGRTLIEKLGWSGRTVTVSTEFFIEAGTLTRVEATLTTDD